MYDLVKVALWVGSLSLLITLGCALYIVNANAGSRNLALGLGALAGACLIFAVQAFFELKSTKFVEDFPFQVTIDYKTKSVRSRQTAITYRNTLTEIAASKVLTASDPPKTKEDAQTIARDLAVLSVISFLDEEQFDWQLDAVVYTTADGTLSRSMPLSSPRECSSFSMENLRAKMRVAGNMFADAPILGLQESICLPPKSDMKISSESIIIKSQVCGITITPSFVALSTRNNDPATAESLANGDPRYIDVVIGTRVTVDYFALRAQDRDLSKYQKWTRRLLEGLKSRFGVIGNP